MNNHVPRLRWLLTLTLLNVLILCITGLPALHADPTPHTFLSWGFYLIAYLAQNSLFAFILAVILSPVFLGLRKNYLTIIISIIPVTLLLWFNFVDARIFAFWRSFVSSSMINLYFAKGGGSQVFEINSDMYVWIVSVFIVFFLLAIGVLLLSRKLAYFFRLKRWVYSLVFIYVAVQVFFIVLCTQNVMPLLQYTMKVPYFYDLSWVNALERSGIQVFPKASLVRKLQVVEADERKLRYPLHPLHYHLPQHPLNVLLIVVDTLRYDMVNQTNMPVVFHFAQHAEQFVDNISGGDCTKPGIFSLFYSIPATYWKSALMHHQGSILIRAFQANHYHFEILGSAPLSSPPFDATVFAHMKNLQIETPGKNALDRDAHVTQEMDSFLNHQSKTQHPFFGFIFYDAPHAYNALPLDKPFHPVGFLNYFSVHNDTPRTPIYNLYKNAVFADDQLIHHLLVTLKKNQLMKNTVVIITADHGQEFNDDHNNYWEHASGFSKYQLRTPMIIAWPNRAPKIYPNQTTHFDLAPTLLKRVLGVTNPVSDYSVGDDFYLKKQPSFIVVGNYAYYAVMMKNKIMQFHHSGFYRWTDLSMNPIHNEKWQSSTRAHFFKVVSMYH